jgi:hypothetical protein
MLANNNYASNQKNSDPAGIINGQADFLNYRFGLFSLDEVGCGIIAIYNVLHLLGMPKKLTDLIREFETNSTETVPFGILGINPFSIKKYFKHQRIPYSKICRMKDLDKQKEEGGVYLLTFWNDAKHLTKGAHTVALCYTGGRFVVYNRTNGSRETAEFENAIDIIGNGLLIRGYRLYGEFHDEENLA